MNLESVERPDAWLNEDESLPYDVIGESEEGRPIRALTAGRGPRRMSLLAGAHADEPAGPTTLRALAAALMTTPEAFRALLEEWTLCIVPHVNPDGEARNASWRAAWPDVRAYLRDVIREKPGRDVEFGYPDMRPENRVVAAYLRTHGPFDVHASLHGMGFSDGAMLLIDKHWGYRTEHMQQAFARAASEHGLRLHDHNRKGEKGFFRIAEGFTTTPEGAAMRTWFRSRGDEPSALLFRDSSMEFVRSLGGDPLSVVTELPLFLVEGAREPETPTAYLAFRELLPEIRAHLAAAAAPLDADAATGGHGTDTGAANGGHGTDTGAANGGHGDARAAALWEPFGLHPIPVRAAVDIHLRTIEAAAATIRGM